MNFHRGTCGIGTTGNIYLCFDYYGKTAQCYQSDDPMKPFKEINEAFYPHASTRIGMGQGYEHFSLLISKLVHSDEFFAVGHTKSPQLYNYAEFYNEVNQEWEKVRFQFSTKLQGCAPNVTNLASKKFM